MRHPFNYLSLLSLPALAWIYFLPPERGFSRLSRLLVFLLPVGQPGRALPASPCAGGRSAFLAECVLLAPLLSSFSWGRLPVPCPRPWASASPSLIFFCLFHTWLEWKEKQGLRMSLRTKTGSSASGTGSSQEELAQLGGRAAGDHRPPGKMDTTTLS